MILLAGGITLYFFAWNVGHDVGYTSGYNTAIIDGKLEIECKFQTRCEKDYERGVQEGLHTIIEMDCGHDKEDSDEPDSVTL